MIRLVFLLALTRGLVRASVEHVAQAPPVVALGSAPVAGAPVVTAASSQYFQRTFNRLVVPQVVAPPPVAPVAPTLQPVFNVAPPPPVFVQPTSPVPVAPTQDGSFQPNVAIAIATAYAAAPVATILLPPYPFGLPPNIGFVPPEQPIYIPDDTKESTTPPTTQPDVPTQEPEQTTPIPSSSDNNFVQALPSNENINYNQYGPPLQGASDVNNEQFPPLQPAPQFTPQQPQFSPQVPPQFNSGQQPQPRPQYKPAPQPLPLQPRPYYGAPKPQKLRTSVEVVPVPLAYIAPPPLHKTHAHLKVVKHVYAYVPATSAKIILRPVKARSVPVRLIKYKTVFKPQNLRANARDIEVTTISSKRPITKPPRV